jgi:hypothetical protein
MSDIESLRKFSTSGGGGFSAFGLGNASGAASYNESNFNKEVRESEKSIVFFDSGDHARFLGYRVFKLLPWMKDSEISWDEGMAYTPSTNEEIVRDYESFLKAQFGVQVT